MVPFFSLSPSLGGGPLSGPNDTISSLGSALASQYGTSGRGSSAGGDIGESTSTAGPKKPMSQGFGEYMANNIKARGGGQGPVKQALNAAINYGVMAGLSALFSDKREKKDIDKFTGSLKGYTFEYKDPSMGPGKRVGVMAQDVAKTQLGKGLIRDVRIGGKDRMAIDIPQALGMALAVLGRMDERVGKLEGKGEK